jgi:hypothetical protein
MTHKTVWRYRLPERSKPRDQFEGVNLAIRLQRTESPEPPEGTSAIELDRQGSEGIEKIEFPITKKTLEDIQEAIWWLKNIELPTGRNRTPEQRPDIQHRCEDESGLVLMREIPSFEDMSDMTTRYMIGDGTGFDYAFESIDELERFAKKLGVLVHAIGKPA